MDQLPQIASPKLRTEIERRNLCNNYRAREYLEPADNPYISTFEDASETKKWINQLKQMSSSSKFEIVRNTLLNEIKSPKWIQYINDQYVLLAYQYHEDFLDLFPSLPLFYDALSTYMLLNNYRSMENLEQAFSEHYDEGKLITFFAAYPKILESVDIIDPETLELETKLAKLEIDPRKRISKLGLSPTPSPAPAPAPVPVYYPEPEQEQRPKRNPRNLEEKLIIRKARKGPSPLVSATSCAVGSLMRGQDGQDYIVIETKGGVHRWIPCSAKTRQDECRRNIKNRCQYERP